MSYSQFLPQYTWADTSFNKMLTTLKLVRNETLRPKHQKLFAASENFSQKFQFPQEPSSVNKIPNHCSRVSMALNTK